MRDRYDHNEVEKRIAKFWEKERIYSFDERSKAKVYSVDTPPPTISGLIHVGHVFSFSQADFISRYKRMRGFNVFYPFGFDNNGLPTELFVEKTHGITAERVGRKRFAELVDAETRRYEGMYRGIWERVGIATDWSLLYTTISKDTQRISQLSFLELNKINRVYRKETPTIWCPKDKTALSQMELKDKLLKSRFVKIRFSKDIAIATTRPELLPACVAIFINPKDKKNSRYLGKKVKVPIFGQEVEIRADVRVDPSKGTGIVMCCTFGDLTDIEWYRAYNLPLRIVMDERARMLPEYFEGMSVRDARDKIIKDLKDRGLLMDEREIEHTVNVHERCGTEIEFIVKKQWFVRYLDMKVELLRLGEKLDWHPDFMKVRYSNWVNGLQWDWSISRQRFYGIPFPVWYCKICDEPVFADEKDLPVNPLSEKPPKNAKCKKCGSVEFVPEEDVLDTWATSSLTPLINARWGLDNRYMNKIYPMSLRPQAHDIISFWLFTTIVKCYLHTRKLPWSDVLISGYGLDPNGKPMHKSLGNIIEPMPIIEKYGADALRHWAGLSRLGDDASFQEKDVMTGARLVNKLWNVAKFVEKSSAEHKRDLSNIVDRWILAKVMTTVREATRMLEEYNYAGAKRLVDEFFWFFSDNYIEFIKHRVYNNDKGPLYALNTAFLTILKMLAPFLPYVTEEIYQGLYRKGERVRSIHVSRWPEFDKKLFDKESVETGDKIQEIIAQVRQWKHANGLALNTEIEELIIEGGIKDGEEDIMGAMKIKKISKGKGELEVPEAGIRISIRK